MQRGPPAARLADLRHPQSDLTSADDPARIAEWAAWSGPNRRRT